MLGGKLAWFTFPLRGASAYKKINEIHVQRDGVWARKLLASVRQSYGSAPFFKQAYALLEGVVLSEESSLSELAQQSVMAVARYLGLETEFVVSTGRYGNEDLRGTDRVLDICRKERAAQYHNLPGGEALYSVDEFSSAGIKLNFVRPALTEYSRKGVPFTVGLSILDLLMFNDRSATLQLIKGAGSR